MDNTNIINKYTEIERDIYKDIVFNMIHKQTTQENNIPDNTEYLNKLIKENNQLNEEIKTLNLTIEKLGSKINDIHREMNILLTPAEERFEKAATHLKEKKIIEHDIIYNALKLAAGLKTV